MKAITIWQPWATLIILGVKPYEFRGWAAPKSLHGHRIGIHAGARKPVRREMVDLVQRLRGDEAWTTGLRPEALPVLEAALSDPTVLPLSALVGTAVLQPPVRAWQIVGELGGAVIDSDRHEHANFAWPLHDILQLIPPVGPMSGAQGFWDAAPSWLDGHDQVPPPATPNQPRAAIPGGLF